MRRGIPSYAVRYPEIRYGGTEHINFNKMYVCSAIETNDIKKILLLLVSLLLKYKGKEQKLNIIKNKDFYCC